MAFSDTQARIAKELVEKALSVEELSERLGMEASDVEKELEPMIRAGVVRRARDKYRLAEAVRRAVKEGISVKPAEYNFRAYVIVEGVSPSKEALEKAQKDLIEKFKNDNYFTVIDLNEEEALENEGIYSSMFEAEVVAKRFEDLVYLVLNYGPSSVELIEPASFELRAGEAQGILVDVANIVHAYAQLIGKYQRELGKARQGLAGLGQMPK